MKKDKKYTKGFRTYQSILLIGIILAYITYLIAGVAGNVFNFGGLLTPMMVHFIVLLLVLTQIHTLLDAYRKLSPKVDLVLSGILAIFAAFLAYQFYLSNLNLLFPIVVAVIALSHIFNVIHLIKSLSNG